mmetsp:Transcript_1847/g.5565  ORF Transcript_1847/g.5565 Transcript_1847/m.5565 type:complete len:309 (-) Transcript_1847:146-1072(-)
MPFSCSGTWRALRPSSPCVPSAKACAATRVPRRRRRAMGRTACSCALPLMDRTSTARMVVGRLLMCLLATRLERGAPTTALSTCNAGCAATTWRRCARGAWVRGAACSRRTPMAPHSESSRRSSAAAGHLQALIASPPPARPVPPCSWSAASQAVANRSWRRRWWVARRSPARPLRLSWRRATTPRGFAYAPWMPTWPALGQMPSCSLAPRASSFSGIRPGLKQCPASGSSTAACIRATGTQGLDQLRTAATLVSGSAWLSEGTAQGGWSVLPRPAVMPSSRGARGRGVRSTASSTWSARSRPMTSRP